MIRDRLYLYEWTSHRGGDQSAVVAAITREEAMETMNASMPQDYVIITEHVEMIGEVRHHEWTEPRIIASSLCVCPDDEL